VASFTDEDDALLGELGVEVEAKSGASRTAREERIIAGIAATPSTAKIATSSSASTPSAWTACASWMNAVICLNRLTIKVC
jgi:hypothetical protein